MSLISLALPVTGAKSSMTETPSAHLEETTLCRLEVRNPQLGLLRPLRSAAWLLPESIPILPDSINAVVSTALPNSSAASLMRASDRDSF